MLSALVISSVYISWVDWRTHRISNKTLFWLFVALYSLSLLNQTHIFPKSALIALTIGAIGYRLGLGAGDVKLIALLSLFFAPTSYAGALDLLRGFTAAAMASLLAVRLQDRLIHGGLAQKSIALGPAICAAFIWCAR